MFSNSMYSGATYFQSAHALHSNSMYSNPSMGLAPHGLNAGSGGDPPEDHGGEAAALAQGATAPGGYRLGDVARAPCGRTERRSPSPGRDGAPRASSAQRTGRWRIA